MSARRATATAALLLVATACSSPSPESSDAASEPPTLEEREGTTTSVPVAPLPVAGAIDLELLGEPHLGPVTLDLPVDCSVAVTEARSESTSTEIDLAYDLTFTAEGGDIVVAMEDVVVERAVSEGRELPVALVPPGVVTRATLVVAPDGAVVDVRGIDELLDAIPDLPPDARPLVEQAMALEAENAWSTWFDTWAVWGSFTDVTEEAVTGEGTREERTVRVESLGTTADGLAVFRLSGTLGAAGVQQFMELLLPELAGQFVDARMHVSDLVEVVTDPDTLRPTSVHYEREASFDDGVEAVQRTETRTTQFDWEASDCE